jgi:ABC-2 type transport system permease protein
MTGLFESALVIARRDFVASVHSRSFILFMLTPLLVVLFSGLIGFVGARSAANEVPVVAVVADSATTEALVEARQHLVSLTSERAFPALRRVDPAENVRVQARTLIADREASLSAVFSGTLERPLLSGPERIDEFVGSRMALILEQAQRSEALRIAAPAVRLPVLQRDVTGEAAGNLRDVRQGVARFGQFVIFFFTLLLSTMLLSNLIEEKSNKVIEVLAAAVPLDAIFFGKLLAMLAVSLLGIALWGAMFGLATAFSMQLLPEGYELPAISPAIGWPIYSMLLLIYYTTNYMLMGSLFLGIGGQANSVREVQTLNMPITFLQMGVFVLSMVVVGARGGMLPILAYVFPFSSPLAMIAEAGQSEKLWPHLLAIPWQFLWVFILIRLSSAIFRKTVLKSGGEMRLMPRFSRQPRKS